MCQVNTCAVQLRKVLFLALDQVGWNFYQQPMNQLQQNTVS